MNVSQSILKETGYKQKLKGTETTLKRIFGASESLFVTDTYQFNDYSKYVAPLFNAEDKAKIRKEEFPKDCQKALEMGVKFAQPNSK